MYSSWLLALALGILAWAFMRKKSQGKTPPGPWGLPVIGNLHQIGTQIDQILTEWGKKYGSIFSMQLGFEKVVVLDDVKLIKEMFDDPVFSGRPTNEFFLLFNNGTNGVVLTEGPIWDFHRRFTVRHLRDFGFGKQNYMNNLISDEVKEVVEWLKSEQGHPISVDRKFSLALVNSLWCMTSGKRYKHNDPLLNKLLDSFSTSFEKTLESMILFFAPWFRHIAPNLSGWNGLQASLEDFRSFFRNTIEEHKETFSEEHIRDLTDQYIKEIKATKDPKSFMYEQEGYKQLEAILSDLFIAGSHTTSITLSWALLYLAHHPQVQKKLQKEIDAVVEKSRVPSLTDRPSMPYADATINEVFRYSSIVSLGVFHTALETKEFHGYTIPKGTWLFANMYSVHYNKDIWGDPENFRPERFLSEDEKSLVKHEALIPFCIGKRQCLGEQMARDTLFLFLTSIFQQFNVLPDPDKLKADFAPKSGYNHIPKPYLVVINERLN